MKSELIIDVQPGDVSIALLEDGRLMSLQKEQRNIAYAVGDIYLAKVKKLMPGLNAAFVNVGYEKDAFLHYLDLGPHFASYDKFLTQLLSDSKHVPQLSRMKLLPDIEKNGSISDRLQQGKELLVQIVKEPISSKGPRLTTELTFTGRYMVLIPFSDKISVSQKIKSTEEKLRLRQLVDSIKPKNFGVIIRTSAEGKRVAELNNELKTLLKCWQDTLEKAQKSTPPALVFEEESRIVGMLRDVFSPSFEAIHINDAETYEQIRKYVTLIAPERADIVKLYTKPEPIFDSFSVTRQIKSSFGKTVSFKSGAYIIIEHTEALHVIDVNSGNRTKATQDQETNALEVNLRAADEIARQLRLRDMGGIIVVDFIDMAKNEHRQVLYDHMKEIMANDRARHNILPLSKFGLMQITRHRVRPVLDISTDETCPSCHGTGRIQPSLLFTDALFEKLEYVVNTMELNHFIVYVHPYVEAYLKKGWLNSIVRQWRRKLGATFKVIADQSLPYLHYRVVDKAGNEINLFQEKDTGSSTASKKESKASTRSGAIDITPELEEAADAARAAAQEAKARRAARTQEAQARAAAKTAKEETAPKNVENTLPAEKTKAENPQTEKSRSGKPQQVKDKAQKKQTELTESEHDGSENVQVQKPKKTKVKALLPVAETNEDTDAKENVLTAETIQAEPMPASEEGEVIPKPSRSARRRARQRAAKAAARAAEIEAGGDLSPDEVKYSDKVNSVDEVKPVLDKEPKGKETLNQEPESEDREVNGPSGQTREESDSVEEQSKIKPKRNRRAKARRADGTVVSTSVHKE